MVYANSLESILGMMERFGGSFVRQLATLYRLGDADNQRRLEAAFPEYFAEYDGVVSIRRQHL